MQLFLLHDLLLELGFFIEMIMTRALIIFCETTTISQIGITQPSCYGMSYKYRIVLYALLITLC